MRNADRNDSGRLFYITGPETEKARSPNLVRVPGFVVQQSVLLVERNEFND
jgi:hypothetical protein